MCPVCGTVHQAAETGLIPFPAFTAAPTTQLAVTGQVRFLAIWRLLPADAATEDPTWERIRRCAAPEPAYLYVPAFSMIRPVVQRLGVRLTEAQPSLQLSAEAPSGAAGRPSLVEAQPQGTGLSVAPAQPVAGTPDFDVISPILTGQREAWGLAHFIHLAIEAREGGDLQTAGASLEPGEQELVFFPAVWDPRYIHESNWRLLLHEFDGLVA